MGSVGSVELSNVRAKSEEKVFGGGGRSGDVRDYVSD